MKIPRKTQTRPPAKIKKKPSRKRRANLARPYCGGEWTEARFFGFIRSGLRQLSSRWAPKFAALKASATGKKINPRTGRLAMHHACALCHGEFPTKDVAVDHIVPCGALQSFDDLPAFVRRLLCEEDGFRVLCHACHQRVTNEARDAEATPTPCPECAGTGMTINTAGYPAPCACRATEFPN